MKRHSATVKEGRHLIDFMYAKEIHKTVVVTDIKVTEKAKEGSDVMTIEKFSFDYKFKVAIIDRMLHVIIGKSLWYSNTFKTNSLENWATVTIYFMHP